MSTLPPPLPTLDPDTAPFWEACRQRELRVQRCEGCEAFRFYPGPICPSCGASESRWQPLSGRGEVYSYVVIHRAVHPAFADDVPFAVALVELDGTDGIRLPARVVECPPEAVHVGMAVTVCFEPVSDEITLPRFRPRDVAADGRPDAESREDE